MPQWITCIPNTLSWLSSVFLTILDRRVLTLYTPCFRILPPGGYASSAVRDTQVWKLTQIQNQGKELWLIVEPVLNLLIIHTWSIFVTKFEHNCFNVQSVLLIGVWCSVRQLHISLKVSVSTPPAATTILFQNSAIVIYIKNPNSTKSYLSWPMVGSHSDFWVLPLSHLCICFSKQSASKLSQRL